MKDTPSPTINGTPLTLIGSPLAVGQRAPDVVLRDGPLSSFNLLNETAGKIRIISVVLCIDTGVCEAQTKWLEERLTEFGAQVVGIAISTDLPETQMRWCGMNGVENVVMLSDHYDLAFGERYGTWLKELRKDQRAIIVIDESDIVRYVEYVPETGHHIDYAGAQSFVADMLAARRAHENSSA